MTTPNEYHAGARVEINTSTVFADDEGTAFDPNVVTFRVKEPGVSAVAYVYNTDAEVTKNGTGDYTLTIDVETEGRWYYRIEGETSGGVNRGADENEFVVKESVFV